MLSNPTDFGGGWYSWPDQGNLDKWKVIELWTEGLPHPVTQGVDMPMADYRPMRLWWRPVM